MHPALFVDRLARLLRFVPVAVHDAVTAGQQFSALPAPHDPTVGVDDLDLQMRMNGADRGDAPFERIVAAALEADRARLRHAIADRHFAHVHVRDHAFHDFNRAGAPAMTPVRSDERS